MAGWDIHLSAIFTGTSEQDDMTCRCHHIRPVTGRTGVVCLGLFLYFLFFPEAVFSEPKKATIYFYTSETSINNFASLKMEFDRYLSRFGDYEFQPFKDRTAFEKQIEKAADGLVLLSSWHYQEIQKTVHLKPVLIGLLGGQMTQKRILVGQTGSSLNQIKQRVSSSADDRFTRLLCDKMLPPQGATEKQYAVLTVPKDIDALMSVGFGISNMALTTENALKRLQVVNPGLHRRMQVLARGQETLLPVLAVLSGKNDQIIGLLDVIEKMPQTEEGRRRIAMLGLDGWHRVRPVDENELKNSEYLTD